MKKIAANRNYRIVKEAQHEEGLGLGSGLTDEEYKAMVKSDFKDDVWAALDWFYKRDQGCWSRWRSGPG